MIGVVPSSLQASFHVMPFVGSSFDVKAAACWRDERAGSMPSAGATLAASARQRLLRRDANGAGTDATVTLPPLPGANG